MPLTEKEMAKLAEKNDWMEIRQNGSHHHFRHKDFNYIVTIPIHGNKDLRRLEKQNLERFGVEIVSLIFYRLEVINYVKIISSNFS
ncbi:type II toxin-antitoxin system HicA family toxin [Streptococcus sp. SN3]|nr:type II toxin-antitoxin system HicA family toxin [Streptococcus sp. SN3]MDN5012765.1 type II toxin-antitoxin system HicA family toxin [Streptococcus sp. SN3]